MASVSVCQFGHMLYPLDQGADLFVHIQGQVIQPAGILAAGAGAFPAAKWLETRPGAGGASLRTVGVGYTRFDLIEEPVRFFR